MEFLKGVLRGETGRFTDLGQQARTLLLSYNVRELARPVFEVFMNAFLWRHFGGFAAPAIYNLGRFVGLPFGFYINALLLRKVSSSTLYFIGTVAQALIVGGVVLLSPRSLPVLFAAAIVYGLGNGIYWGNRNFLSIASVRPDNRGYFVALELASAKIVGILAPAAIGWFIAAGGAFGSYSIDFAYRALAAAAFVLQSLSGYLVMRQIYDQPKIPRLFLKQPDRAWQLMRRFSLIAGTLDGLHAFLGVFLVLALIGQEGEVGLVQGVSTFVTAILLYWVGRTAKTSSAPRVLQFGIWLLLVAALCLAFFYSPLAAITYIIFTALGAAFFYQSWNVIYYNAADGRGSPELRYSRIFDHEIFLNFGRVTGVLAFLGLLAVLGQESTLRFLPLAAVLLQLGTVPFAKGISSSEVDPKPVAVVETRA